MEKLARALVVVLFVLPTLGASMASAQWYYSAWAEEVVPSNGNFWSNRAKAEIFFDSHLKAYWANSYGNGIWNAVAGDWIRAAIYCSATPNGSGEWLISAWEDPANGNAYPHIIEYCPASKPYMRRPIVQIASQQNLSYLYVNKL